MSKKKKEPTSWVLTVEVTRTLEIVCEECTREEAVADPWNYAVDERELGQSDWEIESIEPNI